MIHTSVAQRTMPPAMPMAMTEPLRLRLGQARDRGSVRRIECACFGRGRLLFGLWPRVGNHHATTWLAEIEHKPVGYLIAYENALDGKLAMYVGGVGVQPPFRRFGIGTRLMRAILAAFGSVWLHVRANNVAAIALYRSLGMQQVRRLESFYANGEDAIVMATPDLMNWDA